MIYKRPEVLAPAGNMEKLRTALLYGADAVYLGGMSHNLRAATDGFTYEELCEAVTLAESRGAQIYFCLNSLPMQSEMASLPLVIEQAAQAGVHAFIIADTGIFRLCKKYAPHIPAHMSTQKNTTNSEAILFWHEMGATRINLARELSSKEIHAIAKATPGMELEIFVHGAMCLAVSGQCLMSAWLNDRPANAGRCTQPCRFQYRLDDGGCVVKESMRPDEPLWYVQTNGPESEHGFSSVWAPEDLCLMPFLPWFFDHNITALKIEGRMKGTAYVAQTTDAYKTAVLAIAEGKNFYYQAYMPELLHTASRPLSTGFFLPHKKRNFTQEVGAVTRLQQQAGQTSESLQQHPLAAVVREPVAQDAFTLAMRGQWKEGSALELMLPGVRRPRLEVGQFSIENMQGQKMTVANSGQQVVLRLEDTDLGRAIEPGVFVRTIL